MLSGSVVMDPALIAAVIIGRNEGQRLRDGLASLSGQVKRIVYVDSGSTDGSPEAARAVGAEVVELDMELPFTAARARNAGILQLTTTGALPEYIQFMDGDCSIQTGWIETAFAFLESHSDVAVACGRRRERFPEATIYNRLIDAEWDTPVGQTRSCGGDALMRTQALIGVGGYNKDLIAGEEPELCVRLRAAGWTIHRLDAEMTWHDAAMTRFGQWWTRNRRAGHAYAEGAALHGAPPERHNVAARNRALFWGLAVPMLALLGALVSPWLLLLLLAWPANAARLVLRGMDPLRAVFITLGKLPEALGILGYWLGRLKGHKTRLIEYK